MTEMERALAAITEAGVTIAETPPPMSQAVHVQGEPVQLQTKRPQTLADQVQQLERIERQISDRLRRDHVEARCTVERKITDARSHHARTLAEETARIDRERDEMIRQAEEEYHAKVHDLAGLLRRRP
jgi:hypothetical protein